MFASDKTSLPYVFFVYSDICCWIKRLIMADKVLEEVTKVDRSSMKKADTIEKNVLPDAEGNVKLDYPIT